MCDYYSRFGYPPPSNWHNFERGFSAAAAAALLAPPAFARPLASGSFSFGLWTAQPIWILKSSRYVLLLRGRARRKRGLGRAWSAFCLLSVLFWFLGPEELGALSGAGELGWRAERRGRRRRQEARPLRPPIPSERSRRKRRRGEGGQGRRDREESSGGQAPYRRPSFLSGCAINKRDPKGTPEFGALSTSDSASGSEGGSRGTGGEVAFFLWVGLRGSCFLSPAPPSLASRRSYLPPARCPLA